MLNVRPDPNNGKFHIEFRRHGVLVVRTEWFAPNASIDIGHDGGPVAITIHGFGTSTRWPLTEEHVNKYGLGEWLDDLKTVYNHFFNVTAGMNVARIEKDGKVLYRAPGSGA